MIAFLQGILTGKQADRVELDVNGIGYEAFVSQRTLSALPAPGANVSLKTYLHVREDALQLFGFLKDNEKQAFLLALSVSGVGPKAALGLLSALDPESFYQCILHNDLNRLKSVPGIGQKTAQHLVLELKDKVAKVAGSGVLLGESVFNAETRNIADAIQGLMGLGYSVAESRRAVLMAAQNLGENSTVEELLRAGLKLTASS